MSLRARLLVGLVALLGVGLLVADIATYFSLNTFLLNRIDQQLKASKPMAMDALFGVRGRGPVPRPPGSSGITYAALYSLDGTRINEQYFALGSSARPVLSSNLPDAGPDVPTIETVGGTGGVSQFRVLIESEDSAGGEFIVMATPLTEVQSTLDQLLILEAAISLAVLLAVAGLAWCIIKISLRPLERMGGTAAAIAAGDLGRRVEPATPKTEIGRLGLALNGMLSQIESAFAERTKSEQRLRRFVASASHELRTPLTSIRGYAELLRRGADRKPDDAALARRRIEEESIRMGVLVDDMLLLARLDQGRPLERAPVDLTAIARDACLDAGAVAPHRTITLNADDRIVVTGDEMRLRQVVGNLMRNALVHTPSGTPIEVDVGHRNGSAVLTVADHGPGLKPDDATRVFDAFYRADPGRSRDRGGAGLGLSIVAAVVASHGGGVKAEETRGGGATFRVELPLASSA